MRTLCAAVPGWPSPARPWTCLQVADYLRIKLHTFHDLKTCGMMAPPRGRIGRSWRFDRDEVRAWALALAGIPYIGDLGVADFHSHGMAFISRLCRAGTDFSTVVDLARHRDPKLTSKIYDQVRLETRTAAINSLTIATGAASADAAS